METKYTQRSHPAFLKKFLLASACASSLMLTAAHAQPVGKIFYILLENRNFTAGTDTTGGGFLGHGLPSCPVHPVWS
jgi:hypothetical protein